MRSLGREKRTGQSSPAHHFSAARKNKKKSDCPFLLVWVLVYVAAFSIGMGPLAWTILAEIFPNRARALAASVCVLLLWTANFLVSQFFPYLLGRFEARVFWGYAVICAVSVAFIWNFIPETKGKSLEDIEGNLSSKRGR